MTFKVEPSDTAIEDLLHIYEHIAYELFMPEAAKGLVERIARCIQSLEQFPMRRPLYQRGQYGKVRFFPIDRYLILYRADEEAGVVTIVRVLHQSQNIQKYLRP